MSPRIHAAACHRPDLSHRLRPGRRLGMISDTGQPPYEAPKSEDTLTECGSQTLGDPHGGVPGSAASRGTAPPSQGVPGCRGRGRRSAAPRSCWYCRQIRANCSYSGVPGCSPRAWTASLNFIPRKIARHSRSRSRWALSLSGSTGVRLLRPSSSRLTCSMSSGLSRLTAHSFLSAKSG
jgi:hypothetical protein